MRGRFRAEIPRMSRSIILIAALTVPFAAACHGPPKAELPSRSGPTVLGVHAVRPGHADNT